MIPQDDLQASQMAEATKDTTEPPAREGATADLPHDRITVERFRQAFPRARWSDRHNAWFVPGRTAQKRIGRWLAEMEAEADRFADDKGRDAYAFEPIESRYLEAAPATLQIRTPYSRAVIDEIRGIPLARWDADRRLWTVPYRSFAELRQRWPVIEAAAKRSEPDARRARREAIKGTEEEELSKGRMRERRRTRYPVPADDPPPFDRAIGTHVGVVFFTRTDGELADPTTVAAFYFAAADGEDYVWISWRRGTLEELVTTWPARAPPGQGERYRGWWIPTLEELRNARRDARAKERKQKDKRASERPADSA